MTKIMKNIKMKNELSVYIGIFLNVSVIKGAFKYIRI